MATMYRLVPKAEARTQKAAEKIAVAHFEALGWTEVRAVGLRGSETGPRFWSLIMEGKQPAQQV